MAAKAHWKKWDFSWR